jgi:hypothetical protein
MSEPLDTPKLVLGAGRMSLEQLARMFRALTGRDPTPEELEEARAHSKEANDESCRPPLSGPGPSSR